MKIIISVAVAIFLLGCSENKTTESTKQDIFKEPTKTVEVKEKKSLELAKEAQEVIPETVDVTTKVIAEETTEVVEVLKSETLATKSGAELYKVCSSCHGQNGEKKALNKSQTIQGWSEVQVSTALNGYKDGSYGGAMKGLMKSQVTKLSDADIATLSTYISGL